MSVVHEITTGLRNKRKQRKGRGEGSKGKTCGKGTKGQKVRGGRPQRVGLEGGQTEHAKRFGRRGFSNFKFASRYAVVNLSSLDKKFDNGKTVDATALVEAGLIADEKLPVKILANGEITKALTVLADKFSGSAQQKIEAAGGTCQNPKGESYQAESQQESDDAAEAPADAPADASAE